MDMANEHSRLKTNIIDGLAEDIMKWGQCSEEIA
jgi:hypothetical protein